ncbi:hypothetical protein HMJ29_00265 [Hymenobacter taeanensis]|uniref:DUF4149 domain-containing protein n=1 Tax=Hymenobacter taeanensis TaxID=2735321 RepID=A0A6M6BBW5_9BACT|nr:MULTISPECIES: hypothetical protein [Hymenobacter]QJX45450.1 hypothetical protein HMJ29_00265 [Hymenobacter taeanensis]UOQ81304.1 hypothetical protein MUN83_00440 [Hymenobacter sp. 5414T-23]
MRTSGSVWWLVLVLVLFVWAGMVAAISFLEAPLKFTAPHITILLGVGIGHIVFHALNRLELIFLLAALLAARIVRAYWVIWVGLGLLAFVLLLQTLWLLPALDVRAAVLLAGHKAPPGQLHLLYIALDVVKLLGLLVTGSQAFQAATAAPTPLSKQIVA